MQYRLISFTIDRRNTCYLTWEFYYGKFSARERQYALPQGYAFINL
jgi:hypothetical protein